MLARKPKPNATYADLCDLPEHLVGEIVRGTLYASPRPATPHSYAASMMGMEVGPAFHRGRGGPGGWWILYEPELHLDEHVLVPDLAGWRRERLPVVPNAPAIPVAPDWLCEVLSPSTHRLDRLRKLPLYAELGVANAWLVDPVARCVEVYRRQDTSWLLVEVADGDRTEARLEPFDAVPLDLSSWWLPGDDAEPMVLADGGARRWAADP